MRNLAFLCSLAALFMGGCASNGSYIQGTLTRTDQSECIKRPPGVYLFFEGEPVSFTYERVGIIEISSEYSPGRQPMLDRMKYEAWLACADGIIAIKNTTKYEPRNHTGRGYYGGYYNRTYYSEVQVYSGIAVKIHKDQAFLDKYGRLNDTSFVRQVKVEEMASEKSRKAGLIGGIAVIGAAVVVMTFLIFGG